MWQGQEAAWLRFIYTQEGGSEGRREGGEKAGNRTRLKTFKIYPQWHTSLSKAPPCKSPIPSEAALPTPRGIQMLEHMETVPHVNHHTKEYSGLLSFDRLLSDCKTMRYFWVIFFLNRFPQIQAWHRVGGARVKEACTQCSSSHSACAFAHSCVKMNMNVCIAPSLWGPARHYSGFRKTGLLKFVSVKSKSKNII